MAAFTYQVLHEVMEPQPGDEAILSIAGSKPRITGPMAEQIIIARFHGRGYSEDRWGALVSGDGTRRIVLKARNVQEFHGGPGRWRKMGSKPKIALATSIVANARKRAGDTAGLEKMIAKKVGFAKIAPVTGQTYNRKIDANVLATLSGIAQSAHKFCNDLRLLAHLKQMEEPFETSQIGSSAMAYKRNPMRCERVTSLSRYVISLASSPAMTAAEQWFERTLDDSANKRLAIPEAFLAIDSILIIVANVMDGLVVYPKVIAAAIEAELPFMATEAILMAAVQAGGDRQELHEKIRVHSHEAAAQVKLQGKPNDLIERLQNDPAFSKVNLKDVLKPEHYIGRAPQQVDEFLREVVAPIKRKLGKYAKVKDVELKV